MVKRIQVSAAAASAAIKQTSAAAKKPQIKMAAPAKTAQIKIAAGPKKGGAKVGAVGKAGAAKAPGNTGKIQGPDTQAMMKMLQGCTGDQKAMMQMLMQFMDGEGSGVADSGADSNKQLLHSAHSKALKKSLKKGEDIVYAVNEVGEGDEKYQAMVTIANQTFAGEASKSKRDAEDSAAEMALSDLYPDAKATGIKRKMAAEEVPPKGQLHQAIQAIRGASCSKEDMEINVEESPSGGFKAVLVLSFMNNARFTGTGASKKDAQNAAAAAALKNNAFKSKLAAAQQANKANKKTKQAIRGPLQQEG